MDIGRRFDGKVALITGAGSGIGRATVERLAREGAAVACIDLTEEATDAAADAAREFGVTAMSLPCDVSDEAAVVAAVRAVVDAHRTLDVVVNMAGILRSEHTHETSLESWNRTISVNLTGTFLVCREALPHLVESHGNIVNAASTSSLSGYPYFSAYAASKGGVLSLTYAIAVEYAKQGVRANAVVPGGIDTDMVGKVRMPDDADFSLVSRLMPIDTMRGPETVASVIAMLASDDAAHINGEYVRCDGGTLS